MNDLCVRVIVTASLARDWISSFRIELRNKQNSIPVFLFSPPANVVISLSHIRTLSLSLSILFYTTSEHVMCQAKKTLCCLFCFASPCIIKPWNTHVRVWLLLLCLHSFSSSSSSSFFASSEEKIDRKKDRNRERAPCKDDRQTKKCERTEKEKINDEDDYYHYSYYQSQSRK